MTEGDAPPAPRPYPVTYDVQPHTANRNRVTVGFRIFLAIPQAILVGGPGIGFAFGWLALPFGDQWWWSFGAGGGALAGAAWACAFISLFSIFFTRPPAARPLGLPPLLHALVGQRLRLRRPAAGRLPAFRLHRRLPRDLRDRGPAGDPRPLVGRAAPHLCHPPHRRPLLLFDLL